MPNQMVKETHEEHLTEEEDGKKVKEKRNIEEEIKMKPQVDPSTEDLTPQELNATITRTLTVGDPYQDLNKVEFNFKDGEFQRCLHFSREVLLYEIEGSLIPVECLELEGQEDGENREEEVEGEESDEEWKEKIAGMNEHQKKMIMDKVILKRKQKEEVIEEKDSDTDSELEEQPEPEGEAAEGETAASPILEEPEEAAAPSKKLVNRFNFSDRSALTYTPLSRDKSTQTIPNPRANLTGQVSQWGIYDAYLKDYNAAQEAREKERMSKMIMSVKKDERAIRKPAKGEDATSKKMTQAIKILERMLNQNTYDNIAQDCQFYEDPADKFRPDEGVLLPLWEFKYVPAKNVAVTEIKWNPLYKDLFGATFGLMDFIEPTNAGYLCIFTLKNPSYPEFVKHFDSGAICLDFHPKKCHYVCVGLRDGSVAVFNMRAARDEPDCRSHVERNHRSLVSSVLWCDDERDRQLGFFSAGGDGRICKWLLLQNELLYTPIITLYIDRNEFTLNNLLSLSKEIDIRASPSCLVFHPKDFEIFMVGTSLGTIYKCSISYASTYFYQMKAHELPIHRINFNCYIPNIFATCSADWRLKIWEDGHTEPLFVFNLESSVGDVQWAPYSSTVLAAVTSVGRVFVYDLNMKKYDPACAQYVVSCDDSIATRLNFNPCGLKMPLILVGDSKGVVTTLKISPNLRMKPKKPKKTENQVPLDDFGQEVKKLEKILSYVREPNAIHLDAEVEGKNSI